VIKQIKRKRIVSIDATTHNGIYRVVVCRTSGKTEPAFSWRTYTTRPVNAYRLLQAVEADKRNSIAISNGCYVVVIGGKNE
jgi:hypothetical protein